MTDVRGSLRFIAMLALVAGCDLGAVPGVGGGDGGTDSGSGSGSGSDDTAATASFTTNITPLVARCATATCHGSGSLQNPTLSSYAELKADNTASGSNRYLSKPWATNIFMTKLPAAATHQTTTWLSVTEETTFQTFIETYGQ